MGLISGFKIFTGIFFFRGIIMKKQVLGFWGGHPYNGRFIGWLFFFFSFFGRIETLFITPPRFYWIFLGGGGTAVCLIFGNPFLKKFEGIKSLFNPFLLKWLMAQGGHLAIKKRARNLSKNKKRLGGHQKKNFFIWSFHVFFTRGVPPKIL